ncbi:hypothetical protein [Corynebacterium kalidii]
MKKTTAIHVGIRPDEFAEGFAENFLRSGDTPRDLYRNLASEAPGQLYLPDRGTATNNGRVIYHIYRISHQTFIAGLIDWAEQALAHIEDTPDAWLRNALAILAGRWSAVNVDADDWCKQVISDYVVGVHGHLSSTEITF